MLSIIRYLFLLFIGFLFVFPFLWMLSTAFKSDQEVLQFPPVWIPANLMWENLIQAWESGPFLQYTFNSFFVAVAILVLQFLTGVPAAYAFARQKFKGRNFLFSLTLVALMIPPQITFLPVFLELNQVNLVNTYAALIIPYAASAFGIFMLRQSFMQVPEEIIEAARLDEASEWQIMWRIMVPHAKPILITFGLFSFIYHWNDYFWPLVMTNEDAIRTLPIGIAMLKQSEGGVAWNILMAGNLFVVVPVLLIFLFAQRHIIRAFIYQGVK
nr:carbohydrate ABC transporter permease [Paenactinomyces guangxiensis]